MSVTGWSVLASLVGAAALAAAFMGYASAGPVLLMGAFGLC
jgi:hypothetical protein